MSDVLLNGQRFRTWNNIDNQEALAIEADTSLSGQREARDLKRLVHGRGYPKRIRIDNGPELIYLHSWHWGQEHQVVLDVIEPSLPPERQALFC